MKRLVLILLCIVLCLGCLIGCGKRVSVEPEAGTVEEMPAEADAPAEEVEPEPEESAAQPEAEEEAPPSVEEEETPEEEIPEQPSEQPEEEPPTEEALVPANEPEAEPEVPEAEPEDPASTEAEEPAALEESTGDPRVLYALGDSIASGYALRAPYTERYSALLTAALSQRDGAEWTEKNFAVAGDTSTDLLNRLRSGYVTGLEEANEITVCIGANNVLGPAGTFLFTYASSLFDTEGTGTDVAAAYDTFRTDAAAGVETLQADLKAIMVELRAKNPTAPITFMTVYNPYRRVDFPIDLDGLPIPLSAMSEVYVGLVNDALRAAAPELGFALVDVYEAFAAAEDRDLVNADSAEGLFVDPHPTAEGHRVIAETFFEEMGN